MSIRVVITKSKPSNWYSVGEHYDVEEVGTLLRNKELYGYYLVDSKLNRSKTIISADVRNHKINICILVDDCEPLIKSNTDHFLDQHI